MRARVRNGCCYGDEGPARSCARPGTGSTESDQRERTLPALCWLTQRGQKFFVASVRTPWRQSYSWMAVKAYNVGKLVFRLLWKNCPQSTPDA